MKGGPAVHPALGCGIALADGPAHHACQSILLPMSQPESPAPRQPEGHAALTREQKIQLLHEELVKLNAQLEYLRLMLRLRKPCDG